MFWFLHHAVKVLLVLAVMAMGVVIYLNWHGFAPAEAWVKTFKRAETDPPPVLGEVVGRVVRVPRGDSVEIRSDSGKLQRFVLAGIQAPPWSRDPLSAEAKRFEESRSFLEKLALSNMARVTYTFMAPEETGGVGMVYVGGTNIAAPLLAAGLAQIHEVGLRAVPILDQVEMRVAEKMAREAGLGIWAGAEIKAETGR